MAYSRCCCCRRKNLELTCSVVVFDKFVGDDEKPYEIDTDDDGLELHCTARVNGEHKHPLGVL